LYSVPKNEERHQKFEQAISYLQENLREITNYFHLSNETFDGSSDKDFSLHKAYSMQTETGSESVIYITTRNSSPDNFFWDFVRFNKFLSNLIEKNKFLDDVYFSSSGETFQVGV
jgi:hypothetical protein